MKGRMPIVRYSHIAERSYGQVETNRRGHAFFEFTKGARGRWSLVKPCGECGRFMLDLFTQGLFTRCRFGEVIGRCRVSGHWTDKQHDLCNECIDPPTVRIAPCDVCGRFGTQRRVSERDGTYVDGFTWPPEPNDTYARSWPRTCAKCARSIRGVARRFDEAEEIKRLVARLKNEVRAYGHQAR